MTLKKSKKTISTIVWLCITAFYCYQYILRALPNIIMIDIINKYNIGSSEFSSFASVYYIGYVIVHIPIGIMFTRVNTRGILSICIILTAIGLAPLAYSTNWTAVVLGRAITGIGSSAAIVGALQTFRIIYPNKFSIMLGAMVFFGLNTVVNTGSLLTTIISIIGINATIRILLYSGLLLAVVTYYITPKFSNSSDQCNITIDIKNTFCNARLVIASILAGLMVSPLEGFADAWGSAFIMTVYCLQKPLADSIILSIFLGMSIGSIILPYIANKTRMYFGITIISGVVMFLCFTYILNYKTTTINTLYCMCFILGICSSYQVVIISKITTFVKKEISGVAAAVANMIIMAFGAVFHKLIGFTLDWNWNGSIIGGHKVYSVDSFVYSIAIIPTAIFLAIIGFIIMLLVNKS